MFTLADSELRVQGQIPRVAKTVRRTFRAEAEREETVSITQPALGAACGEL